MAKNKVQKKKDRERQVAQKKHAAAVKKREENKTVEPKKERAQFMAKPASEPEKDLSAQRNLFPK
jgi:hypothetical protein